MADERPPPRRRAAGGELFLLVTQGPDAGARLVVGDRPKTVGRSRDADLALRDRRVSRRHLDVAREGAGARVRLRDGASRMLVRGESCDEALVKAGEAVVIGDTVLTLGEEPATARIASKRDAAPLSRDGVEVSSVSTLLGDASGELRGLGAVFSLTDELDPARDVDGVRAAIARWAEWIGAIDATLMIDDEARADASARNLVLTDQIAWQRARDDAEVVISVPVSAEPPAHLVVRLEGRRGGADMHRLLAVAGRLVGSGLARVRRVTTLEGDAAELRQLALGSARAFLGESPAAQAVANVLPKLARTNATVLLLGESGTGKTFVARLLHEMGPRASEPLRVINCAAIPEALIEGELFGHERGAFTSALAQRVGAFEAVGRGTLLLDEIAELPPTSQAKLLRVLEERRFERIGSNRSIALEARVIAATNRDLKEMIEAGRFRSDLYFRVATVSVVLPSLRERGRDLATLAHQILRDLAPSVGRRVERFSPSAMKVLSAYAWPGNVRELRNAIEHALVLGEGDTIEATDLPVSIRSGEGDAGGGDPSVVRLPASLATLEARGIDAALRATGGNRAQAAALLGINRVTLYKKLRDRG